MWSIGVLVGLPAGIIVFVGGLVLAWFMWRDMAGYDDELQWFGFIGGCLASLAALVLLVIGLYPFDSQYHKWTTKTGTVAEVNRRMIANSDDGGTDQKFVIRFTSGTQEYGCNDTRCALVKKGDKVQLSCKRVWQYSGTDGWDCNYLRTEK